MTPDQRRRIEACIGAPIARVSALSGGCIAQVMRVESAAGARVVVKAGSPGDALDIEGRSLTLLNREGGLPTPAVHLSEPDLLVMESMPAGGAITADVERHAADLIARLHDATAPRFGLDFDVRIGSLPQPNTGSRSSVDFFRDQRLLYMGRSALDAGRLPPRLFGMLESLAGRLDAHIGEPPAPALLHGDLWTGNVLAADGRVSGFIDPAIYYGHPEMDLAFSTLFGTFGDAFFDRYREHRPVDYAGFVEARRDICNLYPLLVHVRLFGGAYTGAVERILRRFVGQ